MFTPEGIHTRLRVQPFVPLRIVTSSGEAYEVYHPDLVLVGQRDMIIGKVNNKNTTFYDSVSRVALMHVTALEDLPLPAKSTGNGQQ